MKFHRLLSVLSHTLGAQTTYLAVLLQRHKYPLLPNLPFPPMDLFRRELSLQECYNPRDALCVHCSKFELGLGTCSIMGRSEMDRNIGFLTAWGMVTCFFIPIFAVFLRKSSWLWSGLNCIIAFAIASILQKIIPSPRPAGACLQNEYSCGMPSGHCTTAYAVFFFILFYLARDVKRNGIKKRLTPWGIVWSCIVIVFMITQLLMAYGRYITYYHTLAQVGWGFFAGLVIGGVCYVTVLLFWAPRVGPWLERKLVRIGFQDDWNYLHGKPVQQRDVATVEPEKQLVTIGQFGDA